LNLQKEHIIFKQVENERTEFKTSFSNETIETLVAFANAKGGNVYIGVSDNGGIIGVTIGKETITQWLNEIKTKTSPVLIPDVEFLNEEDKEIVVFNIQEYPIKPVSFRGKYYKRVMNSNQLMTTAEVVNVHLQTFNTSWDYHIDQEHSIEYISLEKVQAAIDLMNQNGNKVLEDPLTFLMKNELLREDKLTHAAYLLFCKNNSILL